MTNASFTIRRVRREDFPRLIELWREMMQLHQSFDPRFATSPGCGDAYLKYLEEIVDDMDWSTLVAEAEGRVLGFVVATILNNPPVYALPKYGYIGEIVVEEANRSQGVGKALWQAAVDWFRRRGVTVVQLNVSGDNAGGQRFWRNLGCRDYLHILWYDIPAK